MPFTPFSLSTPEWALNMDEPEASSHPGKGLKMERMPGHWVLPRLGKRVLRPGGMQLTRQMLARLGISRTDRVVEFAPGMGVSDEGFLGALRFGWNALRASDARHRVLEMRSTFRRYRNELGAVAIVVVKR